MAPTIEAKKTKLFGKLRSHEYPRKSTSNLRLSKGALSLYAASVNSFFSMSFDFNSRAALISINSGPRLKFAHPTLNPIPCRNSVRLDRPYRYPKVIFRQNP